MTSSEKVEGATAFPSPAADPYAPTAWGNYDEEKTMPSGQKCRVRKLGFEDFLDAGLLDSMNTLQGVVDKNVRKGSGQPPVDPIKLMKDKRTSSNMTGIINKVVIMSVTAPKIFPAPAEFKDREVGKVYVDTVGMMDKLEIFSLAVGEMNALEEFRQKAGESTQRMADEPSDAVSP